MVAPCGSARAPTRPLRASGTGVRRPTRTAHSAGGGTRPPSGAKRWREKTSCVPSGEKPSIESVMFFGFATTTGSPPRTSTNAIASATCPQPQPSSTAAVSRLGERMNHGVSPNSFFGVPPAAGAAKSS